MQIRWWWSAAAVVALLTILSVPTTSAQDELDAQSLERSVLDLLTPLIGVVSESLQSFIDIGKIGLGVAKFINIIFDQVFNASAVDMAFGSYIPLADRKILAMFELLSRRLDQMEHGVHGISSSLRELAHGMQNMVRWEIALDTMEGYARPINTLYKRFILYQKMKDKIEDHTLMDFANAVVSHHPHSIMSLMAHLHTMAAPEVAQYANSRLNINLETFTVLNDPKDSYSVSQKVTRKMLLHEKLIGNEHTGPSKLFLRPSIFRMLQDAIRTSDRCQLHQSPQQLLEGLYVMLALTEARGFAMLEFSWMILRVYNEGNFTVEQEVSEQLYLQYSADIMREAKAAMARESQEFYRCDPRQHREGDTYVQLTELLQGYIENEVDMNSGGSCSQNCRYYKHAKSENCYAPKTQYCGKHRRCMGTLHHCTFYDADATVCLSRKPYRRYEVIKYENGLVLGGPNYHCDHSASMKVDSWWRFLYHCSYCLCLCDDSDSPSTDRYFSLIPVISDTQRNMIVTGVKFTKQRRVMHLQIQEGQALPQGQVNTSTLHWVSVEPISIISTAYAEGTHYKKLSFEERSIDMDRLVAPLQHVVTGVRFRMLGSHLNLEVQITPVNFTTGKLSPHRSYWISNDNTPVMAKKPRQEIQLHYPDDPTKFPALSKIDSEPDTFLRFGPTDRGKDVAQLTVPFLDAQTVAPTPSSWFSGIELYHKGQRGSGGFLGLKVITYNATAHMQTEDSITMTVSLPSIPSV